MNIVKELENVLSRPNFMGGRDTVGVNLAVNAILDKIEELGFDIVEKPKKRDAGKKEFEVELKSMTTSYSEFVEAFSEDDAIQQLRERFIKEGDPRAYWSMSAKELKEDEFND